MNKITLWPLVLLLLIVAGCSKNEQENNKVVKESHEEINDKEEKPLQENTNTDQGEEEPLIVIDFNAERQLFEVNGISTGDTPERVIQVMGDPTKTYEDNRFDYSFQDAQYSETMMFAFDDLGVNYIQAESITEEGNLLSSSFNDQFSGEIYRGTAELAKELEVDSLMVYVANENSILVIQETKDNQTDLKRTYMIAPIYGWTWSRGWDMNTFQDQSRFIKIEASQ